MMGIKKALILAVVTILVATGSPMAEVEWADASWDNVLKEAKTDNKYVLIDFYATWCGPCKRMDTDTYAKADVSKWLHSVAIPVKYDAEKGVGEELATKYKIHAYPTVLLLGPDGKEVERYIGYLNAEDFVTTIKGFTEGVGTTAYFEEKLKNAPDDLELLKTLGTMHVDAGRPEKAIECLTKYLEIDKGGEGHDEILYNLGDVSYGNGEYETAKTYFNKVLSEFKDTELKGRCLSRLARAEHKMGNSDAAVTTYEKIVAMDPEDPGTLNGFTWFCAQRGIGLEKALAVALKAVELSNRDAGILDTLGELYFARGEFDDAIKIGKEVLASDPSDQYFKDQVERFTKAKAEAEARASN